MWVVPEIVLNLQLLVQWRRFRLVYFIILHSDLKIFFFFFFLEAPDNFFTHLALLLTTGIKTFRFFKFTFPYLNKYNLLQNCVLGMTRNYIKWWGSSSGKCDISLPRSTLILRGIICYDFIHGSNRSSVKFVMYKVM